MAKSAATKIGFLFRYKRFFTPLHLLTLYKAQIRPCLEYGSHLWRRASKYSLATLDIIQKQAIRLIDDSSLTDSLDFLAHRKNVSALSLYCRYYHGRCSDELKSVNPPPKRALRVARVSPIPNTRSRSNWKSAGPLHSLISLSLWLKGIGTLSLPPSFRALTIFKPSKPGLTKTYASTLSLDQLSLLFSNARIFRGS